MHLAAPAYTRSIHERGQDDTTSPVAGQAPGVDAFLSRVLALTDTERKAVAAARRAVDETFHERALHAASELLVGRGELYADARRAVSRAHIPAALEGHELSEAERVELEEVARAVQLAIDDGLLAVLTSDRLHPNHARELHRSLKVAFDP